MRECIECGMSFQPNCNTHKICSHECKLSRNKYIKKQFPDRICRVCETTFQPKAHNSLVCSVVCKKKHAAHRQKLRYQKNTNGHREYCFEYAKRPEVIEMRKKRRRASKAKEIAERPLLVKTCVSCHSTYYTEQKNKQYCTTECRLKTWYAQPKNAISQRMRRRMRRTLRDLQKHSYTFDIVGYTPVQLMHHLESQFVEGMSWDNMDEWHIDHIRPISSFEFNSTDDPEFKACWTLDNLQPLWGPDNISKGAKWEGLTDAEA